MSNSCHDLNEANISEDIAGKKILLVGNPNVGKSVFFSNYTKINAVSSNFAGTTVSYLKGTLDFGEEKYTLIDVPGIFSLNGKTVADEVALKFVHSNPQAIIFILDATNLTRSVELALELKEFDIPTVYALNFLDVAKGKGIEINTKLLEELLGSPVIETIATQNIGLDELKKELLSQMTLGHKLNVGCKKCSKKEIYQDATDIVRKVRKSSSEKDIRKDKLSDMMVKPTTGVPIALFVLTLALAIVVFGGKVSRVVFFLPIVRNIIIPFFDNLVSMFVNEGMLKNILVGEYGIFVIGFEWPLTLILPYVLFFYVVFAFLEDCGYIPRLTILFDNLMSKIGLQGGSIINLSMAYGCAVPAIIGTRTYGTKKERLIVTTLISFTVPCISQIGALIELISSRSYLLFIPLFLIGFTLFIIVSYILGKTLEGIVEPLIIQLPNLLIPNRKSYFRKILIRMKSFMVDAEGPMFIAILIAALLKETGALDAFATFASPLVKDWLGLPAQATDGLILGIVRREMSVTPLIGLGLNSLQILVASVVSLLYIPCLSVFGVVAAEFNAKTSVMIVILTTGGAFVIGGLINQIGLLLL